MEDNTFRENKPFVDNSNAMKKKFHLISGRIIGIIDNSLVESYGIDENTWFMQEALEGGILLRICRRNELDIAHFFSLLAIMLAILAGVSLTWALPQNNLQQQEIMAAIIVWRR